MVPLSLRREVKKFSQEITTGLSTWGLIQLLVPIRVLLSTLPRWQGCARLMHNVDLPIAPPFDVLTTTFGYTVRHYRDALAVMGHFYTMKWEESPRSSVAVQSGVVRPLEHHAPN
jgi:hypothetical protein